MQLNHANSTARSRSTEMWHNGVKEDSAHSADRYWVRLTLASDTLLRVVVHATIAAFRVTLEADVASLAPIASPTVLDDPVLGATVLAVTDRYNSMVDDIILATSIENATFVVEPFVSGH